ncbi:hypothetical protein ABET36_03070, partial [Caldifermentibacillus hisashii]|uniref:hypothetical protein n=1 Tax=Caldifermentibacillus hisashii TaxID=996558 RepID=UPI003D2092C5
NAFFFVRCLFKEDYSESSKMHSHFLRAMPIRGSKSVLIAGRSSLYVAKRALCAFLLIFQKVVTK